jgi:hypothetical protein
MSESKFPGILTAEGAACAGRGAPDPARKDNISARTLTHDSRKGRLDTAGSPRNWWGIWHAHAILVNLTTWESQAAEMDDLL